MICSIFKKILWFFVVLTLSACIEEKKENAQRSPKHEENPETLQKIGQLVTKLNSSSQSEQHSIDSINLLNQKIVHHIEKIQSKVDFQRAISAYAEEERNFKLSYSEDTLAGVFSWNTSLGGSSPKYRSVLLKINGKKAEHVLVPDDSVLHEGIQKLNVAGNSPVYLLFGKGKASYTEYFYKLSAYSYLKNHLTAKTLFPKNKNYVSCYYSLEDQKEESEFKIQIFNQGLEILIPESWGQTVVYKSFVFDRNQYVEKSHTISDNNSFSDSDFQFEPSFGFINGSEIPVAKNSEEETIFLFTDSTKIKIEYNREKHVTNVLVINDKQDQNSVELSGLLEVKGKLNEYIFFAGNGVPEAWPLFVYNLNNQDKTLQKEIAGAFLKDGFLYYKEVLQEKQVEKTPCNEEFGDQTGYFKVNVLDYALELPIMQSTNHVICGFVQ